MNSVYCGTKLQVVLMITETITLYKYIGEEGLKDVIKNHRIKATNLFNSNDSMECLPAFDNDEQKRRFEKGREELKKLMAICLTSAPKNGNMWDRYAERHQGACLKFKIDVEDHSCDIQREYEMPAESKFHLIKYENTRGDEHCNREDGEQQVILKVLYREERCPYPTNDEKKVPAGLKLLAYKDKSWSYEEEYRIPYEDTQLTKEGGNYYSYRLFLFLSGIILGSKCGISEEEIKESIGIVPSDGDFQVLRSQIDNKNFSVET